MASGKSVTRANLALDYLLEVGSPTRPGATNNIRLALTTTNPTASTTGTELTGTGYSAGGELVVFGTAASGSTTGDTTSAITWTNGSGGTWSIAGCYLHDAGASSPSATDVIYWDDAFDVSVPDAATLEIAIDGITVTEA